MNLRENLLQVQENIENATSRVGRKADSVRLIAVTKTVSHEVIQELISLGVQYIGENRVSVASDKKKLINNADNIEWHMIGTLQRKKVSKALEIFDYFHSVDSVLLAEEISRRATKDIPILLEVNVSGEESKHGFSPFQLAQNIEKLFVLPHITIKGLMTMAPLGGDSAVWRYCFSSLREMLEKYNEQYSSNLHMTELSMGMSQDYEIAIEEGATMVRVGTALYS